MIKVTDLSKIFRTEEIETTALNGVSFEIKEGEFVAIMGPSGCGKSTLLNILGLLDNPSGGSYELMGQEVAKLKERDRTRFRKGNIGFVFQSFNLIDELNVFENVELPLLYQGLPRRERREDRPAQKQETAAPAEAVQTPAPAVPQDLGEEVDDEKAQAIRRFLSGLLEQMESSAEGKENVPEGTGHPLEASAPRRGKKRSVDVSHPAGAGAGADQPSALLL